MKIFIDRADGKFVSSPGYKGANPRISFKRGDSGLLEIGFYDGAGAAELVDGSLVKFGLKEKGKYDGNFLVYLDVWSKDGNIYAGEPDFNTTQLNELLNHGDADDSNDEDYTEVMMELSWSEDGVKWLSSETINVLVYNDVIKGNEGVPVSGSPQYPSAEEALGGLRAANTNFKIISSLYAVQDADMGGVLIAPANDFTTAISLTSVTIDGRIIIRANAAAISVGGGITETIEAGEQKEFVRADGVWQMLDKVDLSGKLDVSPQGDVDIDGTLTTGEQDLNNPESVLNNSQVMGLIANPLPSARKTQLITSGIHPSLFTAGNVVSDSWIGDCYVIQEKFCVSYQAGVNSNVALYNGRLRVTPGVGNSQYLTMTSGFYASAFSVASDVSVGVNLSSYNGSAGCNFFVGLGQYSVHYGTVCEVGWLFVGQFGNRYSVFESFKIKGDNNINGRDITIPHTDVSDVSVFTNVNMNFYAQKTIPIKMYLTGNVPTMEIEGRVLSHSQTMLIDQPLSPIIGVHGLTSSGGLQIQQLTVIDTY